MALTINNFAQLLKYSKALIPSECLADAKTAKAVLHTTQDSQHLPQLHMTYRPVHYVELTLEEATEAIKLGYVVEQTSAFGGEAPEKPFHTYAQEKHERHLWFMNFRRYGWSFTSDSTGEYGYGRGVTYANGPAMYFMADTPAEKIRDAMVASWAMAVGEGYVPDYFHCQEVHQLLRWLLDDAIANATDHATPRRPGSGWNMVQTSRTDVLPENMPGAAKDSNHRVAAAK